MVVEWDAREMGAAARGRGEEENNILYFLSTNLKFEVFLDGEEKLRGPGQACKGHYCVHPVLARAL